MLLTGRFMQQEDEVRFIVFLAYLVRELLRNARVVDFVRWFARQAVVFTSCPWHEDGEVSAGCRMVYPGAYASVPSRCAIGNSLAKVAQAYSHLPRALLRTTNLGWVQNADPRVELEYGDAARSGLEDNSASLVSLSLVVHELSTEGRRSVSSRRSRGGVVVQFLHSGMSTTRLLAKLSNVYSWYVDNGMNLSGVYVTRCPPNQ